MSNTMRVAFLLAVFAQTSANEPLYDFSSSPLVQLDDSNFDSLVLKDEKRCAVANTFTPQRAAHS